MMTADKIRTDITAYWIALMLVFVMHDLFERQSMEWILMKL